MRTRILLLLSLFSFGAVLASCQSNTGNKLTPEEMKQVLDSKKDVFLLDVRTPIELRKNGMLPGVVNIPLNELPGRLNEVPKNRTVITICAAGVRAKKASDLLADHGYTAPRTFGMNDWVAKGYPVEHPKEEQKQ